VDNASQIHGSFALPEARKCAKRIAVIRPDGEHAFVDEFIVTAFGAATHARLIFRFGRDRCTQKRDGSFLIVRTGERLRRAAPSGGSAFAR